MDLLIVCIFSLALGSFANNLISHFALGTGFDLLHSKCYCGKQKLRLREVIPLLSFIVLKAKCSLCKNKISSRYPAVELIIMATGVISYLKFGFSLLFLFNFLVYYTLLIIGIIDFLAYRIPNKLVAALFCLVILQAVFGIKDISSGNIIQSTLTCAAFLIINLASESLRNISLIGFGDIKLVAVLFLLFNFPGSILALWLAALLGVIAYKLLNSSRNITKISFGACLSLSFILCSLSEEVLGAVFKAWMQL